MHTYSTTKRQRQMLTFIGRYIAAHGMAPTYREIGEGFGVQLAEAHRMVARLAERGHIRRLPNRARALEIVRPTPAAPRKPLSYPSPKAEFFLWDAEAKALKLMERKL